MKSAFSKSNARVFYLFRRSVSVFVLAAFASTHFFSSSYASTTNAPAQKNLPLDLTRIVVPKEIGKLQEVFQGKENKVVILIQDAHAIPDAQRSIQKLIEYFQAAYGLNLIALEGSSSVLDAQIFKSFPDQLLLKRTFEAYFEKGELTGSTAAAIFNAAPAVYRGIEDWSLYEEGLELYLKANQNEPQIVGKIDALKKDLRKQKEAAYSRELLDLDGTLADFHANHNNLMDVLRKLAKVQAPEKGSELALLVEEGAKNKENQTSIGTEVKKIAGQVKNFLESFPDGSADRAAFNNQFQEFQTSRISPESFALFLNELAAKDHLPMQVSQGLAHWMGVQKRMRDIEGTKLFRDFEKYAASVKGSLLKNAAQRKLDQATRKLELLERLTRLELSREDWNEISVKSLEPPLQEFLKSHIAFYENAQKRDLIFFKNLSSLMNKHQATTSLLIAGGFHTEGVIQKLKTNGISYLLVTPQMGQIPEKTHYREHLRGEVSWKNYFEIENGKVNLYKAFVRGSRDKLLKENKDASNQLLKRWRDQIIRDLAQQQKITAAGQYTSFIDETVQKDPRNQLRKQWLANIDRFVEGLLKLQAQGQLTEQNIFKLFPSATIPEEATSAVLSPSALSRVIAEHITGAALEAALLTPQEIKNKRSEVRGLGHGVLASGGELSASQHRIVNDAIASYFKEGKAVQANETVYGQLDPNGVLKGMGAKIYILDGLNQRIREIAQKAGTTFGDRVIAHPGMNRSGGTEKNVYLDAAEAARLSKLHANERSAWANHEQTHLNEPGLSEAEVQKKAPIEELLTALRQLRVEERLPLVVQDALQAAPDTSDKDKRYMLRQITTGQRSAGEVSTAIALAAQHGVTGRQMLQLADRHKVTLPMVSEILDMTKSYETDTAHVSSWMRAVHAAEQGDNIESRDDAIESWGQAPLQDKQAVLEVTSELLELIKEFEGVEDSYKVLTMAKLLKLYKAVGDVKGIAGVREVIEAIFNTQLTQRETRQAASVYSRRYREVLQRIEDTGGLTFDVANFFTDNRREERRSEVRVSRNEEDLVFTASGKSLTTAQYAIVREATDALIKERDSKLQSGSSLIYDSYALDTHAKYAAVKVDLYRINFLNERIHELAAERGVPFRDYVIAVPGHWIVTKVPGIWNERGRPVKSEIKGPEDKVSLIFDSAGYEQLKKMPVEFRDRFVQNQVLYFKHPRWTRDQINAKAPIKDVLLNFYENKERLFYGSLFPDLGLNIRRKASDQPAEPELIFKQVFGENFSRTQEWKKLSKTKEWSELSKTGLPPILQLTKNIHAAKEMIRSYAGFEISFLIHLGTNLKIPVALQDDTIVFDISFLSLMPEEMRAILSYAFDHQNRTNRVDLNDPMAREQVAYFETVRDLITKEASFRKALLSGMRKLAKAGWNTDAHIRYLEAIEKSSANASVKKINMDIIRSGKESIERTYRNIIKNNLMNPQSQKMFFHEILEAVNGPVESQPAPRQLEDAFYSVPTVIEIAKLAYALPPLSYEQAASILHSSPELVFAGRTQGWERLVPHMMIPPFEELAADIKRGSASSILKHFLKRAVKTDNFSGLKYKAAMEGSYALQILIGRGPLQNLTAGLNQDEKTLLTAQFQPVFYVKDAYNDEMSRFLQSVAGLVEGVQSGQWRDGASYLQKRGDIQGIATMLASIRKADSVQEIYARTKVFSKPDIRMDLVEKAHSEIVKKLIEQWGVGLGVLLRPAEPSADLRSLLASYPAVFRSVMAQYEPEAIAEGGPLFESLLLLREDLKEKGSEKFLSKTREMLEAGLRVIAGVDLYDSSKALSVERAAYRYILAIKDPQGLTLVGRIFANYVSGKTTPHTYEYVRLALTAGGEHNALSAIAHYILKRELASGNRKAGFIDVLKTYPETARKEVITGMFKNAADFLKSAAGLDADLKTFLLSYMPPETVAGYLDTTKNDDTVQQILRNLPPILTRDITSKMASKISGKDHLYKKIYQEFLDNPSFQSAKIETKIGDVVTNYFVILGVPRSANKDMVKKSYRILARLYHPDRNPGDKEAEALFKRVQEAYDILDDSEKRAPYQRNIVNTAQLFPGVPWYQRIPPEVVEQLAAETRSEVRKLAETLKPESAVTETEKQQAASFALAAVNAENIANFAAMLRSEARTAAIDSENTDIAGIEAVYREETAHLIDLMKLVLAQSPEQKVELSFEFTHQSNPDSAKGAIAAFAPSIERLVLIGEGKEQAASIAKATGISVTTTRSLETYRPDTKTQGLLPLIQPSDNGYQGKNAAILAIGMNSKGADEFSTLTYYAEQYGEIIKTGIGLAAALSRESREQIIRRFQTGNFDRLDQRLVNLLKAVLLDEYAAKTGNQVVGFTNKGIVINAVALAAYMAYRSEMRIQASA